MSTTLPWYSRGRTLAHAGVVMSWSVDLCQALKTRSGPAKTHHSDAVVRGDDKALLFRNMLFRNKSFGVDPEVDYQTGSQRCPFVLAEDD